MYFISRSANLTLPIRDRSYKYHPVTGAVIETIPALAVKFQHSGTVPEYAQEAVAAMADWGTGVGLNEDPFSLCGSFDTDAEAVREGWSDEDKAYVESVLVAGSGSLYVLANAPTVAKPWPKYDELVGKDAAEKIAATVETLGLNPSDVVAYERENGAREDVLSALELLVAVVDADTVAVIQA